MPAKNRGGISTSGGSELHARQYKISPIGIDMSEWQKIETIPKDGNTFIGWLTNGNGTGFPCYECRYNNDGALEVYGRVDYDVDDWYVWYGGITHWMPPLPPPPGD